MWDKTYRSSNQCSSPEGKYAPHPITEKNFMIEQY